MLAKLLARIRCPKVFCIGQNKTGTTSLMQALIDLGYKVGDQATAELLIHDYARRNFQPIIEYCHTADAFQDMPFSLPYTYEILDYVFPGSKFILSVRDNEYEWYQSLVRYHAKRMKIKGIPTKEDFMNDHYQYQGFTWETNRILTETPEDDPLNEKYLKEKYLQHNEEIIHYFKYKNNLLTLNLKNKDSYQKFCNFLEVAPLYAEFPWLKRSHGT